MRLPDGFEWAAPGLHPDDWCIRYTGAAVMLCGRALHGSKRGEVGFVPAAQPETPGRVHERCRELAAGLHGVCRVCGGDIALNGGLIVGHGQWRVGRDGLERTDQPCVGAGQSPESGR